jgi:hypothetical protein
MKLLSGEAGTQNVALARVLGMLPISTIEQHLKSIIRLLSTQSPRDRVETEICSAAVKALSKIAPEALQEEDAQNIERALLEKLDCLDAEAQGAGRALLQSEPLSKRQRTE